MGFCFVESCYSWIVIIHRIHSFCGWDVWPGFFAFLEMILFYSMPWPGAMVSWLLMESMAMGLYPGFILFMIQARFLLDQEYKKAKT